jgi:hypothetical protein
MMVQRLLILLVNKKNNNMKCAIALDINEGKYPATVEQFGAKTIASTAVVHPRDLSVKNVLPTVSELENSSTFPKQLVTYLQTANQLLKALEPWCDGRCRINGPAYS